MNGNPGTCGSRHLVILPTLIFLACASGVAWGQRVTEISAADGTSYDYFGGYTQAGGVSATRIGADFAIVGAVGWNDLTGAAYVYERDEGGIDQWGQTAVLHPSDMSAEQGFGLNVSLQNDIALIGAPGDGASSVGDGILYPAPGAVYVWERDTSVPDGWTQRAKLVVPNPDPTFLGTFLGYGDSYVFDDGEVIAGSGATMNATGVAACFCTPFGRGSRLGLCGRNKASGRAFGWLVRT